MCRIGQNTRCDNTGCEWLRVDGTHCIDRPINSVDVQFFYKHMKFSCPVPVKKVYKPKAKTVKASKSLEVRKKVKEIDFSKIKTVKQDDWISKIKVI